MQDKISKLQTPNFERGENNQENMTEQYFRNMGFDNSTVKKIEESINSSESINVFEDALLKQDDFIDSVNFYIDSLDQSQIKDIVDLVMCCSGYYSQLYNSFDIAQEKIKQILKKQDVNVEFQSSDGPIDKFRKQVDEYFQFQGDKDKVDGILMKSLEEQFNQRDGENINILNQTKNFFDGDQVKQYRDNLDSIISVLRSIKQYLDLQAKIINSLYFKFEVPDIISIVIQLQIILSMSYLQDILADQNPKLQASNNKFQFYLEQLYQTLYSCDSSDSIETMIDLSKFESLMNMSQNSGDYMIVNLINMFIDNGKEQSIDPNTIKEAHQFDSQLKDLNNVSNNKLNLELQKNLCNQCTVIPGIIGGIGSVIQNVIDIMQEMLSKSLNSILVKLDKNINQFKFSLFLDFSSQIIDSLIDMFEKMKFNNIEQLFDLDFNKCIQIFKEDVSIDIGKELNIDIFEKLGLNPETMQTDPNEINDYINEGYYTGNDLFSQFNSLMDILNGEEQNQKVEIDLKNKVFSTENSTLSQNITFSVKNKTNGKYSVYIKYPNETKYKVFYTGDLNNDKINKQNNMISVKVPKQLTFVMYELEEVNLFVKLESGEKSKEQTYFCDFINKSEQILKTEDYTVQVNENSDMRLPIIFRYLKSNKNKIVQYELYDKYGNKIENNSFNVNEQSVISYNLYKLNQNKLQIDLVDDQPILQVLKVESERHEFNIEVLKQQEDVEQPISNPIDGLPGSDETPENGEQGNESVVNFINEAIKNQSENESMDLNSLTKFIGKNKSYYDIQKRINDIKEV